MRRFPVFALLALFITCTTYDNAIVYRKNFNPGTHAQLRFSGYYRDLNTSEASLSNRVKPFYFYANGSAFVAEQSTGEPVDATWIKTSAAKGSWGNYKIMGDTMLLERFQQNGSNYNRIILKGAISENKIHWVKRKERNEEYKPVDYTIEFTPAALKPDSTQNWIRTKKKYNK